MMAVGLVVGTITGLYTDSVMCDLASGVVTSVILIRLRIKRASI